MQQNESLELGFSFALTAVSPSSGVISASLRPVVVACSKFQSAGTRWANEATLEEHKFLAGFSTT
jgi:hypothetical protein